LGVNGKNRVVSFDVVDLYPPEKKAISEKYKNIKFFIENLLDNPERAKKLFSEAFLIYLDVGEHWGDLEAAFYKLIQESNFVGELIIDDIILRPEMVKFWNDITEEKISLADKHNTGTGYVKFYERKT